jgi:ribosome-associated protein
MQYHVSVRPSGSNKISSSKYRNTHYYHCAVMVVIMVQLLRHQQHHQPSGRIMNTYLFRIVHAWTAPIQGRGKTLSYSNRYGTTTTTTTASTSKHITNNYFGIPCGTCRWHRINRLCDDDIKLFPRTVFDPNPTNRHRIPVRLFATNEIKIDDDDALDDSDLYEYDETESNQWAVPKSIFIPEDRIGMKFVRSSGAGGQNVNKVSSCVQIRFHVLSADWMGPLEVRQRFAQQYKNTISKHDGVYHLESQVHRSQSDNRKDVVKKLEAAILQVWPRPKVRKLRVGLSERGKQKRKEEKLKQSSKKEGRRNERFDF